VEGRISTGRIVALDAAGGLLQEQIVPQSPLGS
jgi:hypothetical protein